MDQDQWNQLFTLVLLPLGVAFARWFEKRRDTGGLRALFAEVVDRLSAVEARLGSLEFPAFPVLATDVDTHQRGGSRRAARRLRAVGPGVAPMVSSGAVAPEGGQNDERG